MPLEDVLEYFGEAEDFGRCGTCDNCRRPAAVPQDARDEDRPGDRVHVSFADGRTRQILRAYVSRA